MIQVRNCMTMGCSVFIVRPLVITSHGWNGNPHWQDSYAKLCSHSVKRWIWKRVMHVTIICRAKMRREMGRQVSQSVSRTVRRCRSHLAYSHKKFHAQQFSSSGSLMSVISLQSWRVGQKSNVVCSRKGDSFMSFMDKLMNLFVIFVPKKLHSSPSVNHI